MTTSISAGPKEDAYKAPLYTWLAVGAVHDVSQFSRCFYVKHMGHQTNFAIHSFILDCDVDVTRCWTYVTELHRLWFWDTWSMDHGRARGAIW
jgi:hypothetical protein